MRSFSTLPRLALAALLAVGLSACDSTGPGDDDGLTPSDSTATDADGGGVVTSQVTAFPVQVDSLWGFMDRDGRLTVAPRFGAADEVFADRAAVREGALWGFARPNGTLAVPTQYVAVGRFTGALAPVRTDAGWGYVDAAGAEVVPPGYDAAQDMTEDRAAVRAGVLWGYVDAAGAVAVEPQFVDAGPFRAGLAAVETPDGWRYIDAAGAFAFGGTFAEARAFSDVGLAPVREAGSETWKFIDRTGRIVLNTTFEGAQPFAEGYARVVQDGRTGLIGPGGDFLVVPKLAEAGAFSEGLAAARFNDDWTYLRRDDGLVIDSPVYSSARPFRGGLAQVTRGSGDDLRTGYIDPRGDVVWEPSN